MGVDATILVRLNGDANVALARKLGYRLGDAVGADFFWIDREEGRGPLTVLDPAEEDYLLECLPQEPGGVLRVNTLHRYYGEGYERGNWPRLAAVIGWLNFNLPTAKVYYGGDSGDLELADGDFLDAMWAHWATVGRSPYAYNGPKQEARLGAMGAFPAWPTCDLCQVPMSRYGFGGNYAAFHCAGCGHDISSRDHGATWETKEQS
jgi:hypothetical protein